MCFGSKADKDDTPAPRPAQRPPSSRQDIKMSSNQQQYAPPSGPPLGHGDFAPPPGPPPIQSYAAPPGPPPHGNYAPPSVPPPRHQYAPPAGPPPSHKDYMAPPSGPPPSESKPKHDWEVAVPDTSLFPPPPAFFTGHDRSWANNATEQEAEAGTEWVKRYPLVQPIHLDAAALEALRTHRISLLQPNGFLGSMNQVAPGVWEVSTQILGPDGDIMGTPDGTIIGYPPLYSVRTHSPLATGRNFKAYYEVQIIKGHAKDKKDKKAKKGSEGPQEVGVSLGFTALPYPNFRLPGWHRGSLAVHGDDGHKYINDMWGGKDFTKPFRVGERLGVGMSFSAKDGRMTVDIFFTRDGRLAGSWNLHEEGDAEQDLAVTGLEGYHDLSCAIGAFDENIFEIILEPSRWKYQP